MAGALCGPRGVGLLCIGGSAEGVFAGGDVFRDGVVVEIFLGIGLLTPFHVVGPGIGEVDAIVKLDDVETGAFGFLRRRRRVMECADGSGAIAGLFEAGLKENL